ncbi:ABC transporter, permease component [Mariniradius saccharolyticus AK6]|uniref:ABC transporter, permease component n=2 Tax=Mariniradius TaxID=1245590 RepID=M7XAT5_9BACT|nr:ABC transporter, permease component [Mariniradius saccharolyticus AK6]
MESKMMNTAKLGAMVLAGLIFLVMMLYIIGKNQNIFGSSITVVAVVEHVSGLVPGNDVRFQGINVGTVKSVEMVNDSTIHVTIYVLNKMRPFIRKNAMTTINTDGLMGNKIIQIVPQAGDAPPIEEGDILYAQPGVDPDRIFKALDVTSGQIAKTSENLFEITERIKLSEGVWKLLGDTTISEELKSTLGAFRAAGSQATTLGKTANEMLHTWENGGGLVNRLFTDSVMSNSFFKTIQDAEKATAEANRTILEIKAMVAEVEAGQGTAGLILKDSATRESIHQSIMMIEKGVEEFNINMEAMRHNFLFRRYFKKLEKEQKKSQP